MPNSSGATTKFAEPIETEEQTRQFNDVKFNSTFGQQGEPDSYQPAPSYKPEPDVKREIKIEGINLSENVLTVLPYIPFSIGIVAGLIELIIVPKSEPKVRYHAAQGLAAQLGILIVLTALGFLSFGSNAADWIGDGFNIVTTIMLLVFAYKAWQGKPIHIESVQDLTVWLEEKIKPQKRIKDKISNLWATISPKLRK